MELSLSLSLGFGSRQREDEHIVLDLNVNRVPTADVAEDGTEAVTGSAHSEEEENGSSRKKLRLSREQSVFLEESFKEHNTLNPKQKVAVAKQLNLRPRQVEVWFQNRRARTKLKQTEVDCEYLKHCCEALTEENRRLHKELSELRALKTPSTSFSSSHSPATTLSMCPSCERTTPVKSSRESNNTASFASLIAKPQYHATPFAAS